jgi:hypothetical protein
MAKIVLEFKRLHEGQADLHHSVVLPIVIPIEGCAVYDSRMSSASFPEHVADRAHGQNQSEIMLNSLFNFKIWIFLYWKLDNEIQYCLF